MNLTHIKFPIFCKDKHSFIHRDKKWVLLTKAHDSTVYIFVSLYGAAELPVVFTGKKGTDVKLSVHDWLLLSHSTSEYFFILSCFINLFLKKDKIALALYYICLISL